MKNFTIQTKIVISFALITLLFCIALGVAISGMHNVKARLDDYFATNQARLDALQNMYGDGLLSGVALRNLVLNPQLKKPYKVTPGAIGRFNDGLARVMRLAGDDAQLRQDLQAVESNWKRTAEAKLKVLDLVKAGKLDEARKVLTTEEHPPWRRVRVAMQKIMGDEAAKVEALRVRIAKEEERALFTALGIGVAALIAGGLVAFFTVLLIRRSFVAVTQSMEDIASGEADLTRRLDESGKDEVAALSRAFNRFVQRIQDTVAQVGGSTLKLAGAASEMSAVSNDALQGVRRQQSETEQAATAMNQMTATVQEVARNASEASLAAQEADKEASEGDRLVRQVVDSIRELADEVQRTSATIDTLNAETEEIGSVLVVIQGIAEQTNLLALNAAIEAARAGEQGRGFAVVADEVRTLASKTQQSTQEIQEMIERLQSGARAAVDAMGQGQGRAAETVTRTEAAGEAIGKISGAVGRIADMNTQIATAAEEQSAVAEEINRSVVSINEVAAQAAEGAAKSANASEALLHLSDELKKLVGAFKV